MYQVMSFIKYYQGDQVKDQAYNTHGRDEEYNILIGRPKTQA